jgi:hypothetical protein
MVFKLILFIQTIYITPNDVIPNAVEILVTRKLSRFVVLTSFLNPTNQIPLLHPNQIPLHYQIPTNQIPLFHPNQIQLLPLTDAGSYPLRIYGESK